MRDGRALLGNCTEHEVDNLSDLIDCNGSAASSGVSRHPEFFCFGEWFHGYSLPVECGFPGIAIFFCVKCRLTPRQVLTKNDS